MPAFLSVWTLVLALLSVCMDSRALVSQCLYGLLCLVLRYRLSCLRFSVFLWTLVLSLKLVSVLASLVKTRPNTFPLNEAIKHRDYSIHINSLSSGCVRNEYLELSCFVKI